MNGLGGMGSPITMPSGMLFVFVSLLLMLVLLRLVDANWGGTGFLVMGGAGRMYLY